MYKTHSVLYTKIKLAMLKNYIKIALRNLQRHKVFSVINILGLAVGMAACYLVFLFVSFEKSYDSFNTKAGRIYRVVSDVKTQSELIQGSISIGPLAPTMKKEFAEVEDAVRVTGDNDILVTHGNVRFTEKRGILADSTLFNLFDFKLLEGNKRTALVQPGSIVISQTAAKKYFGNEDPLGKQVQLTGNKINTTITGVIKDIPENSQVKADIIVSMSSSKMLFGQASSDSEWTNHNYYTYLLLKPNVYASALEAKFPAFMEKHRGKLSRELGMFEYLHLEPLRDVYLKSTRDGNKTPKITNVYMFGVVAVFILLLACINFINLTTARSAERAKEVGIRKVVGAARIQLAKQFIGESVIISLLAFMFAVVLCIIFMPLFNQLAGKVISTSIVNNPYGIAGLLLLSIGIGVVAGFYPSLVLSSFMPVVVLKGKFTTGMRGLMLRKGLVVFQFMVSVVLIVGTIVVYRQLMYMRNQNLGFSKDQEIIIYTNGDKNKDAFKQSLSTIHGVLSTAYSSAVPGNDNFSSGYSQIQNKAGEMQKTNIDINFVDFDFIKQYGLKIVAGRSFDRKFPSDTGTAMIINETAAKMFGYTTAADAVGRNFDQWGRQGTIIGVVKDFNYRGLQKSIAPMVMRIETWGWGTISVKVSSAKLPETIQAIESKWNKAIPSMPFQYEFLDDMFNSQYKAEEKFGNLFLNFSVLAIFISCLGLVGLASYSTIQRTKEIGVRKVLGASVGNIISLLSMEFVKLVAIAFVIAAPLGWYIMHVWQNGFAYKAPINWQVFTLAGITSLVIAFSAISFQAVKAALANPVKSLRTE